MGGHVVEPVGTEVGVAEAAAIEQPRIVAVTASVLASARTAFVGAGADEFLTKPVRLATLDATLRRIAPAGGQPPAPAGPS